jgi:hypothetical protein
MFHTYLACRSIPQLGIVAACLAGPDQWPNSAESPGPAAHSL